MKRTQSGFTMIELIVVIVILGILAATALPKFLDLGNEAKESAVKGLAGAAASAMTVNYAGCSAVGQTPGAKCTKVDDCTDVTSILQGGLPSEYEVVTGVALTTNGATAECTIKRADNATVFATFTGIGAGN